MIVRVKQDRKQYVLVGVAHVSKQSVKLVKKVIREENPDVVALELDDERLSHLLNPRRWQEKDLLQVMRERKVMALLFHLMFAGVQQRIAKDLGVKPGSEMLAAYKEARAHRIKVELVDRPIAITMKRMLGMMGLREKLKLLYFLLAGLFASKSLSEQDVERLKRSDVLSELIEELGSELPAVKKVLLDERNSYIAAKLSSLKAQKVVVVLGAGHVKGVQKELLSANTRDAQTVLSELSSLPKKRAIFWKWMLVGGLLGLFIGVLLVKGMSALLHLTIYWVLFNGLFAALGAAIVRAHPLSILTAFITAPFTSLHPTLAAGWFAGAVELKKKPPKVKDFDGLRELSSLRELNKNRVTHILLVVAATNMGSIIGTLFVLPYVAYVLFT